MTKVLPSRWGLKIIDILLILFVVSFIVAKLSPTSGIAIWLLQGWNLAGATIQWFFGGLVKLFHAL